MTKYRANRVDNGEEVKGSLIEARDGIFILETGNYSILFKEPDYHSQGMGCGLEDRNITDRYRAMLYGWECAMFRVEESYPDFIEVIPESVAQYTTINDKKDVEIYGSVRINGKMSKGGDIVQMNELENHVRVAVVWCAKEARFTYDTKAFSLKCYTVEVIGRQYDDKGKI